MNKQSLSAKPQTSRKGSSPFVLRVCKFDPVCVDEKEVNSVRSVCVCVCVCVCVWRVCVVDSWFTASPGLSQTDKTLGLGGAAHLWCRAVIAVNWFTGQFIVLISTTQILVGSRRLIHPFFLSTVYFINTHYLFFKYFNTLLWPRVAV